MLLRTMLVFSLLVSFVRGNDEIPQSIARLMLYAAESEGHLTGLPEPISYPEIEKSFITKASEVTPVVVTTSGTVHGTSWPEAHAFYEIPYAVPPIGDLRFQPPQPLVNSTSDTINATTNRYLRCYQANMDCINGVEDEDCPYNMDEDCLVLNVYTPTEIDLSDSAISPTQRLPVMFYIHGGSFNAGGGTKSVLDGRFLCNVTNTIVVAINYRLGPFGFLVHGVGDDAIQGNQGLRDQQLALQWVQDNIENFGGDKTRVTIFGNSAGAQSVMFHLISAVSKPHFNTGIMQSNPAVFSYQTPQDSIRITERLLDGIGCNESISERECLMTSSPTTISNQQAFVALRSLVDEADVMGLVEPYRPVVDGTEYTDQPLVLFKNGKWNTEKEVILGTNSEELEIMQFYYPEELPFTETAFNLVNTIIFGTLKGRQVSNKYKRDYHNAEDGDDYKITFGIELTHFYFTCPTRAMARFSSDTTSSSVYYYINEHPAPDESCVSRNNGSESSCYYSAHAAEIPFVFRTGPFVGMNFNESDIAVQNQFSTYWGSFAKTGDPSQGLEDSLGEFSSWPMYKKDPTAIPVRQRSEFHTLYRAILNGVRVSDRVDNYKVALLEDTFPWQNIRIKAPTSYVEYNHEEDICDFWDDLNYYIDLSPSSTTSTETDDDTTKTMTTTALDDDTESTTDSASILSVSTVSVTMCLVVSAFIQRII